ncbi:S9 family peptidase [Bacillus kexueae]|uniref:S9 family peptidase n=1 Tax=Aeribacillus kexueae TaxID=2078952 RepID=UPI001FAF721A|nr:prolyl oligopeptidase family serine peptidase [Bacillus kexueae]
MLTFPKPSTQQFLQFIRMEDFTVSPDETQVIISTNLNGKFNLWSLNLPNHFPSLLTFFNQPIDSLHFVESGDFILVGFDQDGDENVQLYALSPNGGEVLPLRKEEGERHFFGHLSNDGKHLYYTSTKGNPMFLNSFKYDVLAGKEVCLIEGKDAPTFIHAVCPHEQSFVSIKDFVNTHSLAFVHTNDDELLLTPQTNEQHTVSNPIYISDNEIYFLTNYDSDFSYLAKFNIPSKKFYKVFSIEKEDFTAMKYSPEEEILYLVGSYGVDDRLYQYHIPSGMSEQVPLPIKVIHKIEVKKSGNLYVMGETTTRLCNLYQSTNQGQDWTELTHYRIPGISEKQLVEPEIITYPSDDGLVIEALWFQANNDIKNDHVVFYPHGGPQASERMIFNPIFQLLLANGYSIFAPNFRGSSNYGLSFMKMVEGNWGDGPRFDNLAGINWLINNGYVDKDKLLLLGGSYGGYMALLLHGRHHEYFKAVVDIFGVSNLLTFLDSIPEYWKSYATQWVGDPIKDRKKLIAHSPITYIDQMVKPMLVIQGANDPRVVKEESDQIVTKLKEKGRHIEYIVLDDEGHGFQKKENEIFVFSKVVEFLNQMIKQEKVC